MRYWASESVSALAAVPPSDQMIAARRVTRIRPGTISVGLVRQGLRRERDVQCFLAHAEVEVEHREGGPLDGRPGDRREDVHELLRDELNGPITDERRDEDEADQGGHDRLQDHEEQLETEDPPPVPIGEAPGAAQRGDRPEMLQ